MRWTNYLGAALTTLLTVGCGATNATGFGSSAAAETVHGTTGQAELDGNRRQQAADHIPAQQAITLGDASSSSVTALEQRQWLVRMREMRRARPIDHRPRRPDPDPHPHWKVRR
ncbi:MAG: hypothetical protein JRI68_25625 [Deltaproteobacteria bacterium]|nr:hypothetical protein [Deltaproteobacteria bacterium]